jgi:hypothetical protein
MQISIKELHLLLYADFDKGIIYWKPRPIEMFKAKRWFTAWNNRFANKPAFTSTNRDGYKTGSLLKRPVTAHRMIFALKHNYWPEFIDHVNGNRSDNRVENLRDATRHDNGRNAKRPCHNTSGHIGVSWNNRDKRWAAYITINRKRKSLGNFFDKESAITCRKHYEKIYGFHENHGRS